MTVRSLRQGGETDARTMLLLLSCFLATAVAIPGSYKRRQDGDLNVQADLHDIVVLVGLPKNLSTSYNSALDFLLRNSKRGHTKLPGQNVPGADAFVEPQTPYQVEIGDDDERSMGKNAGVAREAEVVIPARRRIDTEPHHEDEMKLIGATEQCGPDRVRDPVTLICRFRVDAVPEQTPEVAPV